MRYLRYLVDRIYYRFNPNALYADIFDALNIDKSVYYTLLTLPDGLSRYRVVMTILIAEAIRSHKRKDVLTPYGYSLGAALLNLAVDLGYAGKSDD